MKYRVDQITVLFYDLYSQVFHILLKLNNNVYISCGLKRIIVKKTFILIPVENRVNNYLY